MIIKNISGSSQDIDIGTAVVTVANNALVALDPGYRWQVNGIYGSKFRVATAAEISNAWVGVATVNSGTGISVDNTDPANPVVTNTGLFSGITTANVLYVTKNWNDATAAANRLDLPYLTIQAALDDASIWDTVVVYPWIYEESISIPDNRNLYGYVGVFIKDEGKVLTIQWSSTISGDIWLISNASGEEAVEIFGSSDTININLLSIQHFSWSVNVSNPLFKFSNTGFTSITIDVKKIVWNNFITGINAGLFNFSTSNTLDIDFYCIDLSTSGGSVVSSTFTWVLNITSDNWTWSNVWDTLRINSWTAGTILVWNSKILASADVYCFNVNNADAKLCLKDNLIYMNGGIDWWAVIGVASSEVYMYGTNISNFPVFTATQKVWTLVVSTDLLRPVL